MRTIKIIDFTGKDARSRSVATEIFNHAESLNDDVVLDFSGVVFVSRGFADEFYGCFHDNADPGFVFSIENACEDVQKMIAAVSKTHNIQKKKENMEKPKIYHAESLEEFDKIMLQFGV